MIEIWKEVVGFERFYEVSSEGRIKNVRNRTATKAGRILKPGSSGKYLQVNLWREGKCKHVLVHLIVAAAFLPPKPTPAHECNHNDRDKENNRSGNLEWMTRSQNQIQACWTLGKRTGDDHYSRKRAA